MRNKIKIQHYVPRFYLRNFSVKKGKTYAIFCFDKVEGKIFYTNIERVGAEKYFYDADRDTNQTIEKAFGKVEVRFNEAYSRLIARENLSFLSEEEKVAIAFFVITQELRTKEYRMFLSNIGKELANWLSKKELSKNLKKQLKEISTDDFLRSSQIKSLIRNTKNFANIMYRMKWILFDNKTSLPFWTSDHPVSRYNPIDLSPYGNLGLVCTGIQIHFPLSPKLSLCFCDPIKYGSLPDRLEVIDEQNIIFQNSLQTISSTRHIFSTDKDFSIAEKMIKRSPELKDIRRKRFEVV